MSTPKHLPPVRTWVPSRAYVGNTTIPISVKCWEWSRRHGLRVRYRNMTWLGWVKADYTLPEFLLAAREGREWAMEVTPKQL